MFAAKPNPLTESLPRRIVSHAEFKRLLIERTGATEYQAKCEANDSRFGIVAWTKVGAELLKVGKGDE